MSDIYDCSGLRVRSEQEATPGLIRGDAKNASQASLAMLSYPWHQRLLGPS